MNNILKPYFIQYIFSANGGPNKPSPKWIGIFLLLSGYLYKNSKSQS